MLNPHPLGNAESWLLGQSICSVSVPRDRGSWRRSPALGDQLSRERDREASPERWASKSSALSGQHPPGQAPPSSPADEGLNAGGPSSARGDRPSSSERSQDQSGASAPLKLQLPAGGTKTSHGQSPFGVDASEVPQTRPVTPEGRYGRHVEGAGKAESLPVTPDRFPSLPLPVLAISAASEF
ncbi:hypothetical protein PAL_GLEAN10012208 [Pteropus alecto]|uniref:Uncharacterized protein n=1 Tax=Pteropus alecto TaxID=9402 RepID=L5KB98_PTEAL|nr:hypothetical protein PAL_GLEAN10012208 [Pteropus alecto]